MAFFSIQNPNLPPPPAPSGRIPTTPLVSLRSTKVPEGRQFIGGSRLAELIVISLSKNSCLIWFHSRCQTTFWFSLSQCTLKCRYFKPDCSSCWFDKLKASTRCNISLWPVKRCICCLIFASWIFVIGWGGTLYEGFQHY